jgi:hypothetical protein
MSERERTGRQQDISKEAVLASLQTVLHSKTFSHSPSLRQALEFIVRNSLASPLEPLKEYTIATEVLGRTSDFDPKADNIVRVQMHRLREKLDEYYLAEGQRDLIRIVMPRGQYITEYVWNPQNGQPTTEDAPQPVAVSPERKTRVDWRWAVGIALVMCNLILVVNHLRPSTRLASPFRSLWEPFLLPSSPPLIVYANPAFLVSKGGDLYRYDPPTILGMPMGSRVPTLENRGGPPARSDETGPFYYFDAFAGSGEVAAVARIAPFITAHGESFLIKRSRLVSYDDIKDHNVIFLGSGKEDDLLKKLPIAQELVFEPPPPDQYPMGSSIRDMNPPPSHPATYRLELDPSTGAIQVEYGLISLLPGVSAGHDVLVLAGITTLGTQAAGDFVTSERSMELLEQMRAAATPKKLRSPFFQALLEVEVRDGVPLDVKCLVVRELNQPAR